MIWWGTDTGDYLLTSEERKTLLEIVQKLKEGKTPEQLVADGMYVYGVRPQCGQ